MFEEFLEDIAQTNGLREINPYLKLATGLGAILLCLVSAGVVAPLFVAVVLSLAILFLAKVPARVYGKLFILPLFFAAMSVAGIILLSGGGEAYWRWEILPWFSLSVTAQSLEKGFFVFCRVIGGMSALIFIALTTPMTDLFGVMRRIGIPEVVLDLAMIIYRSIFLIMDQLVQTYQAQVMRLGYGTFRESIHSFATMCGSVFIASWDAGEDLMRAMDARCYSGKFAVLGEARPVEILPALAVAGFLLSASLVALVSGGFTLGGALP